MSVILRDEHLEGQIEAEKNRRGDATMAKTACDLLREYLMQLSIRREQSTQAAAVADAANSSDSTNDQRTKVSA